MKTKDILKIVSKEIVDFNNPSCVQIALSNGRGVDAIPCVEVGDKVKKGQIIAKIDNQMLGVDVHSSIDGVVENIYFSNALSSENANSICIKSDEKQDFDKIKKLSKTKIVTVSALRKRMLQAGVVGCGGAGFPSYAKIKENVDYKYLIVNACVSDYFACADLSVLYHEYEEILKGIVLLNDILNFEKIYVSVNSFAKKILNNIVQEFKKSNIDFVFMPNKLGQGSEKVLCKKILNYEAVDTFPSYDGILVFNVQTIQNIFRAIELGLPMISRVVTLYGKSLNENINCRVLIGSKARDVIKSTVGEICEYEYFEEREESAKNAFWELNDLRKEFKDNKDEEFVKHFVKKRKEVNETLFDFIKFEHLNKKHLRERIQINGNVYGKEIKSLDYAIQKNQYALGILNKKESNKL